MRRVRLVWIFLALFTLSFLSWFGNLTYTGRGRGPGDVGLGAIRHTNAAGERLFGVGTRSVARCVAGETWSHVRKELTPPPTMEYTAFPELKGARDSDALILSGDPRKYSVCRLRRVCANSSHVMLVMDDAGERERLGPRLERCGELWRPGIHPLCSCFFERLQPVLVPPEAVAELPFRSGHHWLEHKWWDHPQWGHFVEAVAHMHAVAQDQQRAETAYGFPPFDGVVLLADQARHQVSWQAAQAMLDVGVAALRSAVPRDGSSSPMCPADALPDGLSESERQIRLRSGLRVYFKEDLDATGGVCFEEASLARPNVVPWREGTQADAFRRDVWRLVGVQPGFHQPLQTHPPLMQALIAPPQQQQQPQPKREGASADTSCRPPRVLFLYRQPTHDWERPRHVLNLAQILDALRRAGVVAPVELATVNERMTAKEQLGLFADFGLLLSAHSSQLVNMVATPSGAAIIELAPAFSDADFGLQAEKLGIFYRIALGTGELPDGYQPERPEEDNCAKGGGYTGVRVPFSRCEPPLTEMNATHFRGLLEQCQDGLWYGVRFAAAAAVVVVTERIALAGGATASRGACPRRAAWSSCSVAARLLRRTSLRTRPLWSGWSGRPSRTCTRDAAAGGLAR